MISRIKPVLLFAIVVAGLATTHALAQAPTDAQRAAIKSSCRSDYMAHCASVPPGGMASLQCLQKNMASLSSSCQVAVKAVEPAAVPATAAESKPGAATKPPATKSSTTKSTANKPAATPAAETTGATTPATATAPAPAAVPAVAAATAPVLVLRPLRPLEEVRIVRAACGADARTFCAAVEPGGGRIARCLAANAPSLSPACKSMLMQFAAQ